MKHCLEPSWSIAAIALALTVATLPETVIAQTARGGGNTSAQLMQQMQQLASDRTSLQAENARIKKDLAEITQERDTLKSARANLEQRARSGEAAFARNTQDRAAAESETGKLKERMQELITKFRETAQTLKDVETERSAFKQSLASRDAELNQCVERNVALYKLNGEVIARLENHGVWSRVASAEPFTRIKRTQLENLIEDYKYRAAEQQATTPASTTASSADHK